MTSGRQFRALVGTTMGVPFGFSLNTSRGPFQDLRVRQAFMHAIDRHWISQNLLFGVINPAWGPLSSSSPEYWPGVEKYYPFNLTAAAKLLDEAGWRMGADGIRQRGGHRLALYLPILLEPAMGVVLQAHARRAGFDLQIEQVTRERQQQHIFANDYDLLSLRWVYADAGVLDVPFLSKNIPAPGRFSFNWSRYQNAALDAALTSAAAASPEKRRDQYGQVQRLIMDQAIFLPVHEEIYDVVYSNRIAGLRLTHGNAQAAFAGVRIAT
jgi:peptide/nickel transport system substrate-binding protein